MPRHSPSPTPLRALAKLLKLPSSMLDFRSQRPGAQPGTAPGLEHAFDLSRPPAEGAIRLRSLDFSAQQTQAQEIEDLEAFLQKEQPSQSVRWVSVEGLNARIVDQLRQHHGFHTLAAEDVMHTPQRPRVEPYEDHLFITTRMIGLDPDGRLFSEQISIFLFESLVLSFQESEGDAFEPIRQRLHTAGSRLRRLDASYLVYALLDAIVDHSFPLMDNYAELLEALEMHIMAGARPELLQQVLSAKKTLTALRRILWPTRDLASALQRIDSIPEVTVTFLRDVHTHTMQLIDLVESHRETADGLIALYMSMTSNRMNEVMKVLTLISTLFIPMTFIAGVYGMNFKHIPELEWPYAYGTFWGVCLAICSGLLLFFKRRGWL